MSVGLVRSATAKQLILATEGQGVLLLNEDGTLHQLLSTGARDITATLPLPTGDLLLGTRAQGLLVWNGRTLEKFHPEFDNLHVTALAADDSGFWLGTRDQGVLHWECRHRRALHHRARPPRQ